MTKMTDRRSLRVAVGLIALAGFTLAQNSSSTAVAQTGGWRPVGSNAPQTEAPYSGSQVDPGPGGPGQTDPNAAGTSSSNPSANYPQSSYPQSSYPQQQYPMQRQQQQPSGNYAPVPAQISIPAGTYLTVRVNQQLSSDHNQPGDAFSATLERPLVSNGVVLAEPGQTIGGRVAQAQKAGRVEGLAKLGVELTDLTLVDGQQLPIRTTLVSRTGNSSVGRDAGAIAATTGVGAAIGAAADWGRGAAIGAGAGAAAGIIGVLVTRGQPSVIYPEQVLTFRIEQPLTISTDHSPQAFRYIQANEYNQPNYSNYNTQANYNYGPQRPAYAVAPAPYYAGYPYYGYPGYYPYYAPGFSLFVGGWGRGYYGYGRGYYGGYRGGYRGGFGGGGRGGRR